ncbi:permease-like cell division protein FtsX [Sphaerisporangium rhizosphaerae]|uniref:Permease-like cell division protein FtsX n=1 Tax=Sphaerisporangium rhizosphaerae TaxID=2269375 RepID=A0ABW2PBK0_9ACTN
MPLEEVPDDPGARRRRPVVVAIVMVLLAGLGVGAWVLRRTEAGPLPPPDAPWPTTGEASVFLCGSGSAQDNCDGRAIMAAQRLMVERTLRGLPEVSAVRFQSRAETLKDFKKAWALSATAREAFRESDMPESFVVDLTSTGDFLRKVETLPGVSNVYVRGTSFWAGKADVAIRLCPRTAPGKNSPCLGRGEASAAEKATIYQTLRDLDGIGAIYLEDRRHATKDAFWAMFARSPDDTKLFAYIPESYHLVLDGPGAVDRVRRAVSGLPGVNNIEQELS